MNSILNQRSSIMMTLPNFYSKFSERKPEKEEEEQLKIVFLR